MALKKLPRGVELRIALLAMLALFVAQLGAMSHAYSHDATLRAPIKHQGVAISHDLCSDCVAYAPVLAPAGTPGTLPSLEQQGHGQAERATADSRVDLSTTLAFRSRAPPTPLRGV